MESGIEGPCNCKQWAEHVQRPGGTHIILRREIVIGYSRSKVCLQGKVEDDGKKVTCILF